MKETGDSALVKRCLDGDRNAFSGLVDRYQKPIYNIMLRMVHDRDDAADLTQTTFFRAYQRLQTFDQRLKFFSWIYRIGVNVALNFLEQRKRTEPLNEHHAATLREEDEPQEDERLQLIERALTKLRPEDRAIILLRHFEGLSYDDIGAVFDIPMKTVKSRLFSARQNLRNLLLRTRTPR